MSEVLTVLARLDGDASGMVRAFTSADRAQKEMAGGADKASRDVTGHFGRMGSGITKTLGPLAGVIAGAFAVDKIVGGVASAVSAASDLNEAGTAVGAVFGPAMGQVQAWAETAAGSIGQSTLQALDAAKTFGVYGAQAGLAADANASFSMTLTNTASDLASFHNADPSEVIEAIGSGLRGEAEPLRRFGILMNEASLESAALKAGIIQTAGPLTAQQKILAANALILGSVGAAAGDFNRTQAGLANQQRIMSANFTNLSATLGSVLLPVLGEAAGVINSVVFPALQSMADAAEGRVGPALDNLGGVFQTIMGVVRPVAETFGSVLGPVLSTLGPQVLQLATSFSPLGILLRALQPVLPLVAQMLGSIGSALSNALAGILPVVTPMLEGLVQILSGALAIVLPIISQLVFALTDTFNQLMPSITPIVGIIGSALLSVLSAVLPLFAALAPAVMQVITAVLPLLPAVLQLVVAFLPLVAVLAQLIGAILPPVISLLMAILGPILALIGPIVGMLTPAISGISKVISVLIGWIGQGISWFVQMASRTQSSSASITTVINGLRNGFNAVFGAIGNIVRGAISLVVSQFQWVQGAANTLGGIFSSVFGRIGSTISGAFSGATSIVRGAINGIIGLANGAIRAVNGISVAIPDWVPGIGGQTFGVHIPTIPMLAKGGTALSSGLALVGERGPELLQLPRGASVMPLGSPQAAAATGGGAATHVTFENHYEMPDVDEEELAHHLAMQARWQLESIGANA